MSTPALSSMRDTSWERAAWLFPLACLIHNGEEILWMAPWSQYVGYGIPPAAPFELAFMALLMTALAYVTTYLALYASRAWIYVNAVYWVAMLVNVIVPHTIISMIERGYTPGLGTVLLVVLPVCAMLLRRSLRERRIALKPLIAMSVVGVPFLLAMSAGLIYLGRRLSAIS